MIQDYGNIVTAATHIHTLKAQDILSPDCCRKKKLSSP